MTNTQVVILGAPRSGTSMLAHVCRLLGVYMGEEFYPLAQGNPGGSLEDVEARNITHPITEGILSPLPALVLSDAQDWAMRDYIASRDRVHPIWGWKDCHTAWIAWQWDARLSNPRYLWIERDILGVLDSWRSTWRFDPVMAMLFLDSWHAAIREFTATRPHLHLHYDTLIEDKDVKTIADYIGLPDADTEAARAWILDRRAKSQ